MSSMAAAWYPCATKTCWAAARSCLRRGERGKRTGRPVAWVPLGADVIFHTPDPLEIATYPLYAHTVASPEATEERAVDETGQSGSPGATGAHHGEGGHTEPTTGPDSAWAAAQSPDDDPFTAIVASWRDPVPGAVSGRAVVAPRDGVNANGATGAFPAVR